MSYVISEMVNQVRSQLDEFNDQNITDDQIIQALNRGQRKATNITARKYDELFWVKTTFQTNSNQRAYSLPANIYGRRVEKVEILRQSVAYEVRKISNHKTTHFITASQVTRPYYYAQNKNQIEFYPQPSGGATVQLHYAARPETLVQDQGRITGYMDVTGDKDYVYVDTLGNDLSTTVAGFNSYVNIIDYVTGAVKATLQIAEIDTTLKQIKFKDASPTRSTVLGRTVDTNLPSTITEDDYVCLVIGTCVPELPEAYSDFLIQYAVVEMRRRLGEPLQEELVHLKELEKEIERMWVGRESSHRVRKSSNYWTSSLGSNLRRLLS